MAAAAFARELARWRAERGLSQKKLAAMMGFDPSYVSHIEGRRHRPTQDFARRAETALGAGGAIWARFREYDELRRPGGAGPLGALGALRPLGALPPLDDDGHGSAVVEEWTPRGTGLVIEDEHALLSYHLPPHQARKPSRGSREATGRAATRARQITDGTDSGAVGEYRCTVRRWLYNAGPEPVIRVPLHIHVDRYPGQADRSNRHYREHPLTLADLDLRAFRGLAARGGAARDGIGSEPGSGEVGNEPGSGEVGEPMGWRAGHDLDSFKEIWLLFENDQARFPLYPGQRTMIEYSYRVSEEKWGAWFQRSVRLPTRRLSIRLEFPATLHPIVWGVQSSLAVEVVPLSTPPLQNSDGDRTSFEWHTDNPSLYTRYRLEWRFRGGSRSGAGR
jgi:transcriptional regulator with XRE-family HTH domain